ncbi:MAG: membrane protein insertase YidC [Spirochaetaceae bacterium]|jgi:YidC/Oxa1 family membrane protein insertase|nr:membrane protein insertase YidC [Spirochaetaceae bacterium]
MEKRTVLAVVLSVIVITAFYFIQAQLYPPIPPEAAAQQTSSQGAPQAAPTATTEQAPVQAPAPQATPLAVPATAAGESAPASEQRLAIETEKLTVTLTNKGGDIVSYLLKEHDDEGNPVNMVLPGDLPPNTFTVAFGTVNAAPLSDFFYINRPSQYVVEFYRDYALATDTFRLTKRYTFDDNEYMFKLDILLDGAKVSNFDFNGAAYTLEFGPQIGPRFAALDNRSDYRQYYIYVNGKRKNQRTDQLIESRPSWASIAGKYFTFIAIPDATPYRMEFSTRAEPGLSNASRFFITRPAVYNESRIADSFYFYLGPKTTDALGIYDNGANDFRLQDTGLSRVATGGGILTPIEWVINWLLKFFYMLARNYGVAIFLITLLVRLILFPLTKKSSEATIKMQAFQPKIQEIQAKYKDNQQQMQLKMAEFYKEVGYNPLSGCLPLLIQMPLLFAMYNVFNTNFDLRGALFIPGWIPDLSQPESIYHLPFTIPLLGWTDIRLLPIIYTVSQMLTTKLTQMPGQQQQGMMKFMMWGMPIIFFFILYDLPSGLSVYWIFSNLLGTAQQLIINRMNKEKKAQIQAELAQQEEKKALLPPKARKKK